MNGISSLDGQVIGAPLGGLPEQHDMAAGKTARATAPALARRFSCAWVETISCPEEMAALRERWDELAAHALERNILYVPAMALAACRNLPAQHVTWLLVWQSEEDQPQQCRLIGLFPFTKSTARWGIPVRSASFWHHLYGFLTTPLVHADHGEAAISAMLDWLQNGAWNTRFFTPRYLREAGAFHTLLLREVDRRGLKWRAQWRHQRAALASNVSGAAYFKATLSHKRLKEFRRKQARLGERGELDFALADTPAAVEQAARAFFELEARGWKGRRGTAFACDAPALRFAEVALKDLGAAGHARIAQLSLDDKMIASAILLISGDSAWLWKIAYDEDFARCSPGVMLMKKLTHALLADGGIALVDSCAMPDHSMIDRIWGERLAMTDLVIEVRPGTVPAELVFLLEVARRRLRGLAKAVYNTFR